MSPWALTMPTEILFALPSNPMAIMTPPPRVETVETTTTARSRFADARASTRLAERGTVRHSAAERDASHPLSYEDDGDDDAKDGDGEDDKGGRCGGRIGARARVRRARCDGGEGECARRNGIILVNDIVVGGARACARARRRRLW